MKRGFSIHESGPISRYFPSVGGGRTHHPAPTRLLNIPLEEASKEDEGDSRNCPGVGALMAKPGALSQISMQGSSSLKFPHSLTHPRLNR